ncbi:MAG: Hsp20/alpha crystallin family protein [Deltaproteobacteria bacterium HGW-Deltaproteobacteria-13]|nr:MAG: Hsp20/alpha crystallin family protein [Deltaproteobacteria bacterium HGW-Deltaproteobacteria-13]
MFNPSIWRMKRFADSFPQIIDLQREINKLFSGAGQNTTLDYPVINIWEKDDSLIVTTELPGMDAENINVSVVGNMLTIAGMSKADPIKEGETYLRQERELGNFQRNFQLPFSVDAAKVEAKYEKGILHITLPRIKEDLPKKIKINS